MTTLPDKTLSVQIVMASEIKKGAIYALRMPAMSVAELGVNLPLIQAQLSHIAHEYGVQFVMLAHGFEILPLNELIESPQFQAAVAKAVEQHIEKLARA
jgi:stage III sporulation protein SpoIIIAA